MKILTITENFSVGGLESRLLSVQEELKRQGWSNIIYGINVSTELKEVKQIKLPNTSNLLSTKNFDIIQTIINNEKPDLIDIHPFSSIDLCGLVAILTKTPFSITLHGIGSLDYLLNNNLAHSIATMAYQVFCVSMPLYKKAKIEFPNTSISLNKNGTSFEKSFRENVQPTKKSLLIVSRLDSYKSTAIEKFLKAISKTIVAKNIIDTIDIVGEGPELPNLKKIAKINNLKINFLGQQPGINLMPKYWLIGGMGRVVIEAASLNIPVILLDYKGVFGLVNKINYECLAENNFVGTNNYLSPGQLDAQINDLVRNYNNYQCREQALRVNNIDHIVSVYLKNIKDSLNENSKIESAKIFNLFEKLVQDKQLAVQTVRTHELVLDVKEKTKKISELEREVREKTLHLNKIYHGKIWKSFMLYFALRDKLIKSMKNLLTTPAELHKFKFRRNLIALIKYGQVIVALPTIDWHAPLYQRPHHLAIQMSKRIKFVFCTCNHYYDQVCGIKTVNQNLIITNLWQEVLKLKPKSWLMLLSTQQLFMTSQIKIHLSRGGKIIYDYVDEIHEDISGSGEIVDFLAKRHQYIKESRCAELVICVSKKLFDEIIDYYPKEKVLLVPNGVDYQHFQVKKNNKKIPSDLANVMALGQPVIGYYGAMAHWLDYDLINETAAKNPQWQFVFIGVDYNGGLALLNRSLPNIHFLGHKDYKDLPKYGVWFDVALIPFAKGEIAKSTSPLKMYEYMAMRIPIVATEDLLECYGYKGVFIAKNNQKNFEITISKALKARDDKKIITALEKAAKDNTWEKRAKIILEKIEKQQFTN